MRRTPSICPSPQFVIKASKYCNLRCDYCYEFAYLGDKRRIGVDAVEAMFENIRGCIEPLGLEKINLVWHGGEPFLIPIEFYERVSGIEKRIFAADIRYINTVQTNLTVLTDRHIAFLKGDFFTSIGVSFDVYGDQRVDTKGRLRTDTVLGNMQKLIDQEIDFGAIAVLARDTLPHIREIYRFYDELGIGHRMLAYYRNASSQQALRHGLEFEELVGAYKDLFHEWLSSELATPVKPISDFVQYAIRYVAQDGGYYFDRYTDERVFIVDINLNVYSDVEPYEAEFCYGNFLTTPLVEIITSEAANRSCEQSAERMRRFCHGCPYFGHCPGEFVANATHERRKLLEARGCPARALLDHIVGVFERTDLKEIILKARGAASDLEELPALSVA